MLTPWYHARNNSDIIYYALIENRDNQYVHRLYLNEALVDEQQGMMGEYILSHDNIQLVANVKLRKTNYSLTVDGQELELIKTNKKKLKEILEGKRIYNEVNPSKADIEAARFRLSELIVPVVLLVVALVVGYFTHTYNSWIRWMPALPAAISGFYLHTVLVHHVPFFKDLRKLALGMAMIMVFLAEGIFKLLFNASIYNM